jgi:hypothetical protein
MYENVCGNSVSRMRNFENCQVNVQWYKKIKCTHMKCHTNVNYSPPTLLPHTFSYIVAILIDNHFDHPI